MNVESVAIKVVDSMVAGIDSYDILHYMTNTGLSDTFESDDEVVDAARDVLEFIQDHSIGLEI